MSGKNKLYLAVDVTIAAALLLSLTTGVGWLLSEGGRNGLAPLGVSRSTWRDLHTWFSLVMVAGAIVHLALHWEWLSSLTRRLGEGKARKARWNYIWDWVLGLALLLATASGLLFLGVGGGYRGGRNPTYVPDIWGLSRGDWSDLHAWLGLGFLAVLVVHQALHWAWIRHTIGRAGRRAHSPNARPQPGESAARQDSGAMGTAR